MGDAPPFEPRKSPRQARARASVDAILEAAAQLFAKHGFEETNTNAVARRAGVSIGTLYQYFPNKEALMVELHRRHVDLVLGALGERLITAVALPLDEACERLVEAMLDVRKDIRTELMELFGVHIRRLRGLNPMKETYRKATALVHAYLERHRDVMRPQNLELAALLVVAAVDRCSEAVVLQDPDSDLTRDAAREITELVLRYLRVEADNETLT